LHQNREIGGAADPGAACWLTAVTVRRLLFWSDEVRGLSAIACFFIVRGNSRTLRDAEGTAEWQATGPENQGMVMSHRRSIRPPSAKFAQVREPG